MTALSSLPLLAYLIFRVSLQAAWVSGRTSRKRDSGGLAAALFVIGALSSALAGFLGMSVALKANVRTANAAKRGLSKAFSVGFGGFGSS
jgi:K(+)-stimulated pyrophosphate-energized sodium pump